MTCLLVSKKRWKNSNQHKLGSMANTKEIRKQISSISNTQKITSAMEMVASSKMRKTQDRMEMGRPYADRMLSVIGHLANSNPEYKLSLIHISEPTRQP